MKLCKSMLLIVVTLLIGISVCSAQQPFIDETKQYSDPMTENILVAMNDDNYSRFSQDFDDKMKVALNETQYRNTIPPIKSKIGQFRSKEMSSIEIKDLYTVVTYKANFSSEPDGVLVRIVFVDKEGKKLISGFWLDSPKLRGK